MVTESKALEVQKEERLPDTSERTRQRSCFVPKSNIFETEDQIVIVMDMPGVQNKDIDISLEKNVLTVIGYTELDEPEGYTLAMAEYNAGDYERSFRISNQIEQEKIEAEYKNGVLRLSLPKAEEAKKRKIDVKVA